MFISAHQLIQPSDLFQVTERIPKSANLLKSKSLAFQKKAGVLDPQKAPLSSHADSQLYPDKEGATHRADAGHDNADARHGHVHCDNAQRQSEAACTGNSNSHSPRSERSMSRTNSASSPPCFILGSNSVSPVATDLAQRSPVSPQDFGVSMQDDAAPSTISSHERQQLTDHSIQSTPTIHDKLSSESTAAEPGKDTLDVSNVRTQPTEGSQASHCLSPTVLNWQLKALSKESTAGSADRPLSVETENKLRSPVDEMRQTHVDCPKSPREARLRSALDDIIASTATTSRGGSRAPSPKAECSSDKAYTAVDKEAPHQHERSDIKQQLATTTLPGQDMSQDKNLQDKKAGVHVEFKENEKEEEKFPRDLRTIKKKQLNKEYKTVVSLTVNGFSRNRIPVNQILDFITFCN